MSTLVERAEALALDVWCTDDELSVVLSATVCCQVSTQDRDEQPN